MTHRPISLALIVWTSLALCACAGTKTSVLPQDGPSMKAIYDTHFETMGIDNPSALREELGGRWPGNGTEDLAGYARTAHTELDTVFPRLPNPTLIMYIFPHLAGAERVPVPGYATTFPMYERAEYALPGEVPADPD